MNIIFDLDGTLADCEHRLRFIKGSGREGSAGKKDWVSFHEECVNDPPITPVVSVLEALWDQYHHIMIFSGRNESVRTKTLWWLAQYINPSTLPDTMTHEDRMRLWDTRLTMRPQNDRRPDHEMKEEWLLALPKFPDLVFDDRASVVSMWRKHGIRCCQVAPGNF